MDFSERLADLVEDERKKQIPRKTIESIARELEISKSTFSAYLNGQREPGSSNLMKIAKYFNVSVDYLLGLNDYKPPLRTEGDRLIEEISKYTGLSPAHIRLLHNSDTWQEKRSRNLIRKAIGILLDYGGIKFFESLLDYFNADYVRFPVDFYRCLDMLSGEESVDYGKDEHNFTDVIIFRSPEGILGMRRGSEVMEALTLNIVTADLKKIKDGFNRDNIDNRERWSVPILPWEEKRKLRFAELQQGPK